MDAKEIKREFINYNEYIFNIKNYKLELAEKEIELKEATEPTIGGFSSEINSDIRSKNKKSDSLLNQAITNIDKEKFYKRQIERIKDLILLYENKLDRVDALINLIDKSGNKELIKKRYIQGYSINKLADELCLDNKSVYKRIDNIIDKIAEKTKK